MPPSRPFRIRGRRPGAAAAAGLLAVAVSTACGPLSAHERPVHAAGVSSPVAPDAPRARDGVHPTSIWTLSPAGAEVIEAGNFTCRVFARVTATGRGLLLRFANDYSPRPTRIDAVTVGIRHALTGPRARRITDVHFDGKRGVTIPAGTSRYSDPVHIGVRRGQSLAVSMYIKSARQTVTYHNYRPMTNYCTGGGGGDATHNASGSAYDE